MLSIICNAFVEEVYDIHSILFHYPIHLGVLFYERERKKEKKMEESYGKRTQPFIDIENSSEWFRWLASKGMDIEKKFRFQNHSRMLFFFCM